MAEIVNIATLKINSDDVIKKSIQLKTEIDKLKISQSALRKEGDTSSATYIKNEVNLKSLGKAYRDNQTFATSLQEANADLDKTMSSNNKSTQELRDSRRNLNQISKQLERSNGELTGSVEEERELRIKINKVIDEQTQALRDQSSEFNTGKDRIGEYSENIEEALENLKKTKVELEENADALTILRDAQVKGSDEWGFYNNSLKENDAEMKEVGKSLKGVTTEMDATSIAGKILSGDIVGLSKDAKDAGGASNLLGAGVKGAAKSMVGLTKSAVAFIATPVGLVLTAILAVFLLVKNSMNRNEESANKIRVAFSAFSGIVNALLKALEPLGDFLIDGLVAGFDLAGSAADGFFNLLEKGLDILGFEEAAKDVAAYKDAIADGVDVARKLALAEIALEKAQRTGRITQLEYQKQAEKLRQVRDDETKSFVQRIAANDRLGVVLKEQLKTEEAIANKSLEYANLRIKLEGATKANLDLQAEALTEISDIQERITGQESEQIVNRVALQKEAAQSYIDSQNRQLEIFKLNQGFRAKTLTEYLVIEEEVAARSLAILDKQLKSRLIKQEEYDLEALKIKTDLAGKQAEVAIANAKDELSAFVKANESKLDNERYLSEQIFEEEKNRLERIAQQRREFELKRLDEGVINQIEYNAAIDAVNEENRVANENLAKERKEAEVEAAAIDTENRLLELEEQGAFEYEVLSERLENERQLELLEAGKTGASLDLINKKFDQRQRNLDSDAVESRIDGYSAVLGGFASIIGEQTAVGKAAAIADATINTYKGAALALATYAPPLGGILAATTVAAGLLQVQKITSVSESYERGGLLVGNSHAMGGIPFTLDGKSGFEAEGGEAIINKRSTARFAPLLSEINAAGGGKRFFNNGAILGQNVQLDAMGIDYEKIGAAVAEANLSLPAPKVAVEEIQDVADDVDTIREIADF